MTEVSPPDVTRSGFVPLVSGTEVHLQQAGAFVVLARGDVSVNQGGANLLLVGGDLSVEQGRRADHHRERRCLDPSGWSARRGSPERDRAVGLGRAGSGWRWVAGWT